jgi:hypothetical protein
MDFSEWVIHSVEGKLALTHLNCNTWVIMVDSSEGRTLNDLMMDARFHKCLTR